MSEDDISFICKHDIVICDLWGKVEGYFEELHRKGILTAFDCATRPDDEACKVAIPHSDYVFFSNDESSMDQLKEQMKEIYNRGPKLVIAMRGEKGSLCFDGIDYHEMGIVHCDDVVDTMGAGDSYIAGFLNAIIRGESIIESMHAGAENATETIKYFGAW